MTYAKIIDGQVDKYPYTIEELKQDNPLVSFAEQISENTLLSYGVAPVIMTGAEYDPVTQVAEQNGCVYNPDRQRWETAWSVRFKTSEELAQEYETKAAQVRQERNAKLAASDWTQGKDIPDSVSAPWATYRQELRDLTEQEGFPFNVVWPQEP